MMEINLLQILSSSVSLTSQWIPGCLYHSLAFLCVVFDTCLFPVIPVSLYSCYFLNFSECSTFSLLTSLFSFFFFNLSMSNWSCLTISPSPQHYLYQCPISLPFYKVLIQLASLHICPLHTHKICLPPSLHHISKVSSFTNHNLYI